MDARLRPETIPYNAPSVILLPKVNLGMISSIPIVVANAVIRSFLFGFCLKNNGSRNVVNIGKVENPIEAMATFDT